MAYRACVSIVDRLVQLARPVAKKHQSYTNRRLRALFTVMRDIYQVCLQLVPVADAPSPWMVRTCDDVAIA
ncbi:hypothetical protein PG988_004627 [Apiospora saccharicola]